MFKIKTGYKFCEYINLQRVNKAKALIEEDKKTFEFISFDCGFSSQSHFSTTFKKYVGLTPNEYKKQAL
ncbi:helix-turn-helix domain-containing protein [Peptoniphilus lacrimalis]|uniref:helix-turn-helix domain-containing protein n=1 Tax=Peptoniphilus lacrimalis TaxID=33031 RepID=UPI001F438F47|nr:AraC family transcriptional regulator [Peptoniphilus lacrimalis]